MTSPDDIDRSQWVTVPEHYGRAIVHTLSGQIDPGTISALRELESDTERAHELRHNIDRWQRVYHPTNDPRPGAKPGRGRPRHSPGQPIFGVRRDDQGWHVDGPQHRLVCDEHGAALTCASATDERGHEVLARIPWPAVCGHLAQHPGRGYGATDERPYSTDYTDPAKLAGPLHYRGHGRTGTAPDETTTTTDQTTNTPGEQLALAI